MGEPAAGTREQLAPLCHCPLVLEPLRESPGGSQLPCELYYW